MDLNHPVAIGRWKIVPAGRPGYFRALIDGKKLDKEFGSRQQAMDALSAQFDVEYGMHRPGDGTSRPRDPLKTENVVGQGYLCEPCAGELHPGVPASYRKVYVYGVMDYTYVCERHNED